MINVEGSYPPPSSQSYQRCKRELTQSKTPVRNDPRNILTALPPGLFPVLKLTSLGTQTSRHSPRPRQVRLQAVHRLLHPGVLRPGDHHEAGEDCLLGEGLGQLAVDRHVVHHAPPDGGGAGVPHHPGAGLVVAGLAVGGEGEGGLRVDLAD